MSKAVITTGGKQYIVSEGDTLSVELLVGSPAVSGVKVTADVLEADVKADKVTSIRYKAKKRVHKVRGHRQHLTTIKIAKIA